MRGAADLRRDRDALAQRLLTVQGEERRRIARDLHDTTLQDLSSALMALDQAGRSATQEGREVSQGVAAGLIERVMQDLRTLSYMLHPPLLREHGLMPALRSYAEGFATRSGLLCDVVEDGTHHPLSADVKLVLFRVAQEAIINAHRHGAARHVQVRLHISPGAARLTVSDDGHGFTPGEDDPPVLGVGLPGMRARLEQIGGSLDIRSSAAGSTVVAVVPLASD